MKYLLSPRIYIYIYIYIYIIYIYIYIYIYILQRFIVVTILLSGLVVAQMQYNLESTHYCNIAIYNIIKTNIY